MESDEALAVMLSMGFPGKEANDALCSNNGNLENAINSLLSPELDLVSTSTTSQDEVKDDKSLTIHCEISQFSLPNGVSACTCIALTNAVMALTELDKKNNNFEDCKKIVTTDFIKDSILAGARNYESRPETNEGVEHMSAEEVLQYLPQYSKYLKLIGEVKQGVLGSDMSLGVTLNACMSDDKLNSSKWSAIAVTKTPETIVVFLPPQSSSLEVFILIDSHPRPQLSVHGGAYSVFCPTMRKLVEKLETIFPKADLGDDIGEVMGMMYNSFDMYTFQLKN